MQNVKLTWSDRTKIAKESLFRGYVFKRTEDQNRGRIFTVITAVRYLFWLNKSAVVRTFEIETIQNWLGHFKHEFIQVEQIVRGSLVQLNSGLFMG